MAKVKCPKCGAEFMQYDNNCLYALNRSGYDVLAMDDGIAEDLFRQALDINPNNFEAIMGVFFSYLNRIDRVQNDCRTAIGVYLVTRSMADAKWELTLANKLMAEDYAEYLIMAFECAPEEIKENVRLLRHYNVDLALKHVQKMIDG